MHHVVHIRPVYGVGEGQWDHALTLGLLCFFGPHTPLIYEYLWCNENGCGPDAKTNPNLRGCRLKTWKILKISLQFFFNEAKIGVKLSQLTDNDIVMLELLYQIRTLPHMGDFEQLHTWGGALCAPSPIFLVCSTNANARVDVSL